MELECFQKNSSSAEALDVTLVEPGETASTRYAFKL